MLKKIILFLLLPALIISCSLALLFYNSRRFIFDLEKKEKDIAERNCHTKDKFTFSRYPLDNKDAEICLENDDSAGAVIKITFKKCEEKNIYLGLRYYLTFALSHAVHNSSLEFMAKGEGNFSLVNNLRIRFRQGPFMKGMAEAEVCLKLAKNWQKVSIPLSEFSNVSDTATGIDFNWEIQEVLFSADSFNSDAPAGLLISGLKITNGQDALYELL